MELVPLCIPPQLLAMGGYGLDDEFNMADGSHLEHLSNHSATDCPVFETWRPHIKTGDRKKK